MRLGKVRLKRLLLLVAVLLVAFLIPAKAVIPVQGATARDWNPDSFWYHPWGPSGVHKGIDIFAERGRPVIAASGGLVVYSGELRAGGNVVAVLSRGGRIHYYAHLEERRVRSGVFVGRGEPVGSVGTSGNAVGKEPHLHYSILSLAPRPWRIRGGPQGWKRAFYVDPGRVLRKS